MVDTRRLKAIKGIILRKFIMERWCDVGVELERG